MFCSAFSTSPSPTRADRHRRATRFDRFDQIVARVLVATLLTMTPLSAFAGTEFEDANYTTYDHSVVTLDNTEAGQTTFGIDTTSTIIEWNDLQQPENNTLQFNFTDSSSIVLNRIGAVHPSRLNGSVISNGTVAFSNPFGIFIGDHAVINVGDLVAIGANVSRSDFMDSQTMTLALSGAVENNGLIRAEGNVTLIGSDVINNGQILAQNGHFLAIAGQQLRIENWNSITSDFLAPKNLSSFLSGGRIENSGSIAAENAAFFGGRIANFGEIEIADGSLLMIAADAVWVTAFDNPVLIKVPNLTGSNEPWSSGALQEVTYAIENHGRINAGLGHVRLAASDPLGFAIRQGTGTAEAPASITARRIELEGGERGRIHLQGTIDASGLSHTSQGGHIDITASMIVLEGATVEASGSRGGGTIHIGGEQEGRGELQRARVVIVDEDSQIRADAIRRGDGGTVILFAEDLTSIEGQISARGGQKEGDGGFVETSGLRHFFISRAPDVSAPLGDGGSWLIDPFNITIVNTAPDCPTEGIACLNKAIDAILAPNFDDIGFDGILRTVSTSENGAMANFVAADLIATALAVGTNVTLSTQAFGLDRGIDDGDIKILDPILINSADTLEGTTAKLTLLAANDIIVDSDIKVVPDPLNENRLNLALTVELRANDEGQVESDRDFNTDILEGDVFINADITTGGGDVILSGASVVQILTSTIDTDGGNVDIRTGSVDRNGLPITWTRRSDDLAVNDAMPAPQISIAGNIDTSDDSDPGGNVVMIANSLNILTTQTGNDLLNIVTGRLTLQQTGTIITGTTTTTEGGQITLAGGTSPQRTADFSTGSVEIQGNLVSAGGNVLILSNHVDPDGDTGAVDVEFIDNGFGVGAERDEGGVIVIDADINTQGGSLSIGSERTQSIRLDGTFDTTRINDSTENGLIQIVALDTSGIDVDDNRYGLGEIIIGIGTASSGTTITTSALLIEARDIIFGILTGANPVQISASGSSTATLPELSPTIVTAEEDASDPLASAEVRVLGNRRLEFNPNTEITAKTIRIVAAPTPTELSYDIPAGIDERSMSETRLIFGGANGAGQSAADGVRLNADRISISVGDGTTATDDLLSADLGTLSAPTPFGLERLARATYDGLQLRDSSTTNRPEEIELTQDARLTITTATPTSEDEFNLAGAFDGAVIGANGMQLTLESSDGVLTIEDAVALNNNAIVMSGSDDGKSFVVLNGGLHLPDPLDFVTSADDTVVFGDGVTALGSGGTTAFDVASLTVSSHGDFTVRQQVVDSIANADQLIFESGRNTGLTLGRGTLIVENGVALQANDHLALLAAANGFGDLLFFAGGSTTSLTSNDLELRAGAGTRSGNTDAATLSRILGLEGPGLTIRDANGDPFGDMTSTATSFSYRQDADIDGETDLPTLTQFGLTPLTGFRAAGDVEYKVRADAGTINLVDGDRFRNTALSLVGLDMASLPAINISDGFTFVGKRIELGGVEDFIFTQRLASAFNRSGTDPDEEITLRAGLSGSGNLSFDSGTQSSVLVKAPRINLVVGVGVDVEPGVVLTSEIDLRNVEFDLAGPGGSTQTFVFQTTSFLELGDLPEKSQFIGGNAGLPDVLAIRVDRGTLELDEFDLDLLPLDLIDDPGRLILEAESIGLTRTDGNDLDLSDPNLNLRLRTNRLLLAAVDADRDAATDPDVDPNTLAQVLIGARLGDTQPLVGMDSDLDDESILIEAYDSSATIATVANFSAVSEDPNVLGGFDLGQDQDLFPNQDPSQGRGPIRIEIQQDGAVTPNTLFNRNVVSGRLRRSAFDDANDLSVATIYPIESLVGSVRVAPENINGGSISLAGVGVTPSDDGIIFDFGAGASPGIFDVETLFASTGASITIADGTQISASDSISLAVGSILFNDNDPGEAFGKLTFGTGMGATTSLSANQITLTAGPSFKLDDPDNDGDGEREIIPNALLPQIDFTNLDEIILNGSAEDSRLVITQSAELDSTLGGTGDYLTPLVAGRTTDGMGDVIQWASLQIDVIQGDLVLNDLDELQISVESLTARTSDLEAKMTINVPDAGSTLTPFDDFRGSVEFQSNDIKFVSTDLNTAINLATEKLTLLSTAPDNGVQTEAELSLLRRDPDFLSRPIVRIHQLADFTDTELARPDQYFVLDALGQRRVRSDLVGIDIELVRTLNGGTLTFDDDLRRRVSTSNLILDSAGDVEIALDGPTPGFDGLDYAALQLTSLDITARNGGGAGDGVITIRPFTIDMNPAPLTIETTGDQRFDGTLALENTLATKGRDITFTRDITAVASPDAGLRVATSGRISFEQDIGSIADPLDHLWITFDTNITTRTPNIEFGRRVDTDADDIFETPVYSDQTVSVLEDILFAAYDFSDGDLSSEIESGLALVATLSGLENFLDTLGLGREKASSIATIGKALGDLRFNSRNGNFIMASGEKLSVGGTAAISVDVGSRLAALGDVSALVLEVDANEIGLVRRASGVVFDRSGESQQDAGPSITANTIDFGSVTPVELGAGRAFRFGLPNPFDLASVPSFLDSFPLFEINPDGRLFVPEDFRFLSTTSDLAERVPILRPIGASRSDFSGALGPKIVPIPTRRLPETIELRDRDRLLTLAVDAHDTPTEIRLARLEGVAVINDLGFPRDGETATVTIGRLDADDADAAIELYEELFGRSGGNSDQVRQILQEALDQYLANTRARRVVGFELRRFVKNRPSTLLDAYRTLESLDTLFRYHRRLGLSAGEYHRIQKRWLRQIQPDGITLDELSEAIHPSRYVRGSDILDIFGR